MITRQNLRDTIVGLKTIAAAYEHSSIHISKLGRTEIMVVFERGGYSVSAPRPYPVHRMLDWAAIARRGGSYTTARGILELHRRYRLQGA